MMTMLAEGQIFAHYRVVHQLGRSISGESYEAEDVRIQRRVTLRLLHPWSTLPNTIQRHFLREMQAISTFSHLYLARVLDYGEYGGQLYVTRRYVSLGSLLGEEGRRCYRPPLTPADAILMTCQLAQALDHIHQHGYVHGSFTFANVLLLNNVTQVDEEKFMPFLIADVGLAHFIRRFGQLETLLLPVTAAPEQLVQRVEPASDQYALAVMLYFWLTGQLPFSGSVEEVEQLKLSETLPSLTALNSQVSPRQEEILRRALRVFPQERYPSVLAFAEALEKSLRAPSTPSYSQAVLDLTDQTSNGTSFENPLPSTPMPDSLPSIPITPPVQMPTQAGATQPEKAPQEDTASEATRASGNGHFEELLLALSHSARPADPDPDQQPPEEQPAPQTPPAPDTPQPAPAPIPQPMPVPIPQPAPRPEPEPEPKPAPVSPRRPEPDIYTPLPEPTKPPAQPAPGESEPPTANSAEQANRPR